MSLSKALDDLYGQPAVFLKRLRSELLLHKRTRHALAREAELHHSFVYRCFSGKRTPSLRVMILLDEAMGRLIKNG